MDQPASTSQSNTSNLSGVENLQALTTVPSKYNLINDGLGQAHSYFDMGDQSMYPYNGSPAWQNITSGTGDGHKENSVYNTVARSANMYQSFTPTANSDLSQRYVTAQPVTIPTQTYVFNSTNLPYLDDTNKTVTNSVNDVLNSRGESSDKEHYAKLVMEGISATATSDHPSHSMNTSHIVTTGHEHVDGEHVDGTFFNPIYPTNRQTALQINQSILSGSTPMIMKDNASTVNTASLSNEHHQIPLTIPTQPTINNIHNPTTNVPFQNVITAQQQIQQSSNLQQVVSVPPPVPSDPAVPIINTAVDISSALVTNHSGTKMYQTTNHSVRSNGESTQDTSTVHLSAQQPPMLPYSIHNVPKAEIGCQNAVTGGGGTLITTAGQNAPQNLLIVNRSDNVNGQSEDSSSGDEHLEFSEDDSDSDDESDEELDTSDLEDLDSSDLEELGLDRESVKRMRKGKSEVYFDDNDEGSDDNNGMITDCSDKLEEPHGLTEGTQISRQKTPTKSTLTDSSASELEEDHVDDMMGLIEDEHVNSQLLKDSEPTSPVPVNVDVEDDDVPIVVVPLDDDGTLPRSDCPSPLDHDTDCDPITQASNNFTDCDPISQANSDSQSGSASNSPLAKVKVEPLEEEQPSEKFPSLKAMTEPRVLNLKEDVLAMFGEDTPFADGDDEKSEPKELISPENAVKLRFKRGRPKGSKSKPLCTPIPDEQTGKLLYPCKKCGKMYRSSYALKLHFVTHSGKMPYSCDLCEKAFTNARSLTMHMKIHTGEKPFKCPVCGISFTQSGSLKVHLERHKGVKKHECHICGRTFSYINSLRGHVSSHTGVKEYSCDQCPKRFPTSSELNRHSRIHTGEKPFTCGVEGCGKAFRTSGQLKVHDRVHTGQKPHRCEICGKGFSQVGNLRTHVLTHSGDRPYPCLVMHCTKAFKTKGDLKRHIISVHKMSAEMLDDSECDENDASNSKRASDDSPLRKDVEISKSLNGNVSKSMEIYKSQKKMLLTNASDTENGQVKKNRTKGGANTIKTGGTGRGPGRPRKPPPPRNVAKEISLENRKNLMTDCQGSIEELQRCVADYQRRIDECQNSIEEHENNICDIEESVVSDDQLTTEDQCEIQESSNRINDYRHKITEYKENITTYEKNINKSKIRAAEYQKGVFREADFDRLKRIAGEVP